MEEKPTQRKKTCETAYDLDVNLLRRLGALRPDVSGCITWNRNGSQLSANLLYQPGVLKVILELDGKSLAQAITLEWSDCHYGGDRRSWLVCPTCIKKKGKLYLDKDSQRFICRVCANLCYESQLESLRDRGTLMARKLHYRLGGEFYDGCATRRRPKGMHSRTYERISNLLHANLNRSWFNLLGFGRPLSEKRIEKIIDYFAY